MKLVVALAVLLVQEPEKKKEPPTSTFKLTLGGLS
jgi:hypothetical protein